MAMLVFACQVQVQGGQCDGTQMNKASFSDDVVGVESLLSLLGRPLGYVLFSPYYPHKDLYFDHFSEASRASRG